MQNLCSAVWFRASFSLCASALLNVSTVTALFCATWHPTGRWGSLLHHWCLPTFWSRMLSRHFTHEEMKNNLSSWNGKEEGRGQNAVTWASPQPWCEPTPEIKCSGIFNASGWSSTSTSYSLVVSLAAVWSEITSCQTLSLLARGTFPLVYDHSLWQGYKELLHLKVKKCYRSWIAACKAHLIQRLQLD